MKIIRKISNNSKERKSKKKNENKHKMNTIRKDNICPVNKILKKRSKKAFVDKFILEGISLISKEKDFKKIIEFKQIVDNEVVDGYYEWSPKTGQTYLSESYLRLIGVTNTTPGIILNWKEYIVKDDLEYINKTYENIFVNKKSNGVYEARFTNSCGKIVHTVTKMRVLYDNKGEPDLVLGTVTDITYLKEIETQLKKNEKIALDAIKNKNIFLAKVSHELRTPLNGIIGFIKLLMTDNTYNNNQNDILRYIKESSVTLMKLIDDLLDFTTLDIKEISLDYSPINISRILDRITKIFEEKAAAKGLVILSDIDSNIPTLLYGDPSRLTQVIVNLIGNSVKFTENGYIKIQVHVENYEEYNEQKKCRLIFKITDTGIGIPQSEINNLFSPFRVAGSADTGSGTGLGLAICKSIVSIMDGKITVKSIVGEGSVFTFNVLLGLYPDAKCKSGNTYKKLEQLNNMDFDSNLSKKYPFSILVAEDHHINQIVICDYLKKFGYSPTIVSNGKEVLLELNSNHYDLVFMDIHMPLMNGYETTEKIRTELRGNVKNIIIIAITANALEGDRDKCIESKMDDYISKPISTEKIYNIIKKYGNQCIYRKTQKKHKIYTRDNSLIDESSSEQMSIANDLNDFSCEKHRLIKKPNIKKLICYDKLVKLYSNVSIINTAINFYLEEYASILRTLNVHLETNNFTEMKEELHSLKNSIIFFHVKDNTPKFISKMELDCDNKNKEILKVKFTRLKFRMRRIYNELVGIINCEN